jgi:proteasome lid subunit RPN8/RPN11
MVAQAQTELPNECCGLLAGRVEIKPCGPVGLVLRRFPLVNEKASPIEFFSEPRSLLDAHKAMRAEGLEILSIYHSHPTTRPVPSRKDVGQNFHGPEVVHLIISLKKNVPETRGWLLAPQQDSGKTGWARWLFAILRWLCRDYKEADIEFVD